jgi:hypothetical protein
MKWARLFLGRLRSARMVAVSEATIHAEEAGPMAQQISVVPRNYAVGPLRYAA